MVEVLLTIEDRARVFARNAHTHQRRANGEPYYRHLSRVVGILQSGLKTMPVPVPMFLLSTVAWLHDIVEDTVFVIDDIRDAFGERIAHSVHLLTRSEDMDYWTYGERLLNSGDLCAILVKYADLKDNLDQVGDGAFSREEEAVLEERWTRLKDKIEGLLVTSEARRWVTQRNVSE